MTTTCTPHIPPKTRYNYGYVHTAVFPNCSPKHIHTRWSVDSPFQVFSTARIITKEADMWHFTYSDPSLYRSPFIAVSVHCIFFSPKYCIQEKKKSRTTQRFCAGPYCFGNGHSLKAHDWLPVWHQPMTARVVELVEIIRQALNRVCVCVWNVYVCVCLYPRTIYVKTECMSVCIPVCVHDAHPSLYSGYWLKLMRSVIASLLSYIFVQSHSLSPISKPSFCCNFSP